MARKTFKTSGNTLGRRVARVAATGGGRSYRGHRSGLWYLVMTAIVVLGLASIAYSKYELVSGKPKSSSSSPSKVYAGLAVDICGQIQPALGPTSTKKTLPVTTTGNGVIQIDTKAPGGSHPTLGDLVRATHGWVLSSSKLHLPGAKKTWANGDRCPGTSKEEKALGVTSSKAAAGKPGYVRVVTWKNDLATKSTVVKDPSSLVLHANEMVTIAFLPKGVSVPKPPTSVADAVIRASAPQAPSSASTPTTSSVPVTPSTLPTTVTTSSKAPVSTTSTKPPSSTTASSSSSSATTTK
jgi:hypothetical protein